MKILIISCVFYPESVISAQTSHQLANVLSSNGHSVTVITSYPSKPSGNLFQGYKRKLFQKELFDEGYEVIRCFTFISSKSNLLNRLLENISFGISSSWIVAKSKKTSVIYANTWPLFAQGITRIIANLRKIPIIFSIQDIYPESLISQKRLRPDCLLIKLLKRLDKINMQSSQAITVISKKFKDIYMNDRGIPDKSIYFIPNWVDERIIVVNQNFSTFRECHGIKQDVLLFVYAGNIGAAAGVEQVIEAFKSLRNVENIKFLIAGDGANLRICEQLVEDNKLKNVLIHSPWLDSETNIVLASADIFVLPTKADQALFSVPSKLINYMFASRPVLCIAKSTSAVAETIDQSGCGWVVDPGNTLMIVGKIKEISRLDREVLLKIGLNGRKYALENFAKEKNLPRIVEILEAVSGDIAG